MDSRAARSASTGRASGAGAPLAPRRVLRFDPWVWATVLVALPCAAVAQSTPTAPAALPLTESPLGLSAYGVEIATEAERLNLARPPASLTLTNQLTATNNGGLARRPEARNDLIASVRPEFALHRRGAGLDLDLQAAATFLGYASGSESGGVLPDVRGNLKSAVIDRWVFLDAAAVVRQSEVDPFGARAGDRSNVNRRTETSYRLSPYIEREFAPNTSFLARHDFASTRNGAGDGARLTSNQTLVRVERQPVPLGAALEATRMRSETNGSLGTRFSLDTLRARGSLAIAQQVVLGVVIGQDRSSYLLSDHTDALYGINAQWTPGPRTQVAAAVEHRFFGKSGSLSIQHRMPIMSFGISLSRQPVMSSSSLGVLGQGTDVRNFLDAILTTRYPDPTVRSGVVDSVVSRRGLDTRPTEAIDLVADYPQLQTTVQLTWVLLVSRNTASLTLYSQTRKRLTWDGDPLSALSTAIADTRQSGSTLQFNRRLTPRLTASALLRWSKISGLAARDTDKSGDTALRLSLLRELSPRTSVSAGVQRDRFTTNVAGQHSYDATLAFVGMSYRF